MLDLGLFSNGTVRGAAIAQIGTSIAMASVMFGLILHFQYAYGWSPVKAGLANLPIIVTMLAATPLSEWLVTRFGHRIACLVGAVFLAGSLVGLVVGRRPRVRSPSRSAWSLMTVGLRTVMTICAVALVDAMPSNRTSIGAALNDTAQEVGTSVGTAVIGTLIAALVTTQLPAGTWSSDLVESFFHGERITYARARGRRRPRRRLGRAHPHRLALHRGARLTERGRGPTRQGPADEPRPAGPFESACGGPARPRGRSGRGRVAATRSRVARTRLPPTPASPSVCCGTT